MVHSSSIDEVVTGSFCMEKSRIGKYEVIIEPGYCKLDDTDGMS